MTFSPPLRRRLLIAGGLIALFTVTGFFILPPILKAQLEKRISTALGRTTTVQKVRVNPYAMSVTLEGVDVRLKDGTGSFLGWNRLYVNFDALASIWRAWTLGEVELDGFHVSAELKADGTFNFADIIERLEALRSSSPSVAAEPGRPIRVGALRVKEARLDFSDRQPKRPFVTSLGPVSFALTEFTTAPAPGAPYRFEAVTEAGERLAWSGTLAMEPLQSRGSFEIANLTLKKYTPYLEEKIQADVTDGRLSLRGDYEASLGQGGRVLKLTGGELQLRDLKVAERGQSDPVVDIPVLDIVDVEADAVAMQATVGRVVLSGGHLVVRREKDGALNLLTMLQAPETAPVAAATAAQPLPQFTVGEVAVKDLRVDLTDLAAPRPARLGLSGVDFSLRNLTLAEGVTMPLQLALNWAPQGAVKVAGQVAIRPELKVELQTDVAGLEIRPLSPYLEALINARVTQGALTSTGAVRVDWVNGAPAVTFDGGVSVEKFSLVDGVRNEELAGFAALALDGLKVTTAPQLTAKLAEVKITAPYARVRVHGDKSVNLAALAKVQPVANEPSASATPAADPAPHIEIGRVVVSEGDFSLSDESVEPQVRTAITRFGGTVVGLSSENLTRAEVDLQAAVDGAGPIAISGKLDPLGARKSVDLKVDFKNVDLLPLSPYSGKYAGYELARGKLALDVTVKVDDRKVSAANVITLNQFTFGAPVPSPDATKLPVRLGVALLKDTNGQIVIDVPVEGSLDDPSFRVGRVVMRVIVNLLTKAAVSPFALLGSMFGGGGEELAYQEFTPGMSALQESEVKKLETMVKALANRPGLSLAIEGGYDAPADTHALKQQKLAALVRSRVWEQRRAEDPSLPPPDQLEITAEAQAAMVKILFDEKFPPGTEFGAPLPPAPVVAAAPVAAKRSLYRRVVSVFTRKAPVAESAKPVVLPADVPAAGPSPKEMSGRLAEAMEISDNELRALAAARAQRVRDYFAGVGGVAAERLFLASGQVGAKENKGPRVFLTLQ